MRMGYRGNGETGGAVRAEGLVAGTRIATAAGWRAVESLRPGDAVQTFAAGLRPLAAVAGAQTGTAAVPEALWPVFVPQDALDNRDDLLLLPDQRVLLVSDCAETLYGERFALVPAAALDGWRGIRRRRPREATDVLHLAFDAPQIVYASRATLVACPGAPSLGPLAPTPHGGCLSLPLAEAMHLAACLMAEDLGVALWGRAAPVPRRRF